MKRKRTLRDMVPRVKKVVKTLRDDLGGKKLWFQSRIGTPPYSYSWSYSFTWSGVPLGSGLCAPETAGT